jgi:hypothetical protein
MNWVALAAKPMGSLGSRSVSITLARIQADRPKSPTAPVSLQKRTHQTATNAINLERKRRKINETDLSPAAHNGLGRFESCRAHQRFQRVVRFLYYRARITVPETRTFVTCLHGSVAGNVTLLVRSDHGVCFSIVDSAVSSRETAKQRSVPPSSNGPSTVDKLRKLATVNGL